MKMSCLNTYHPLHYTRKVPFYGLQTYSRPGCHHSSPQNHNKTLTHLIHRSQRSRIWKSKDQPRHRNSPDNVSRSLKSLMIRGNESESDCNRRSSWTPKLPRLHS